MQKLELFIGGYGAGISSARFDPTTGTVEDVALVAKVPSASFVASHPRLPILYCVSEVDGGSVIALSRRQRQPWMELSRSSSGGGGPCHLSVDPKGDAVYVANYGSGRVSALALQPDGSFDGRISIDQHVGSGPDLNRQEKAHAHSIYPHPDGERVVCADLGCDAVFFYTPDTGKCLLGPPTKVLTLPGAGPRHIAFSKDGTRMYVVTELSNMVEVFDSEGQRLQSLSTLPADFAGKSYCAEIRLHPSGRFAYASNRGHNSITTFEVENGDGKLTLLTTTPSGGDWPRGFEVDPEGSWLIVANQRSDLICTFRLDSHTGLPVNVEASLSIEKPACVRFAASFP